MMDALTLDQLRTFIAIAEARSFRGAAGLEPQGWASAASAALRQAPLGPAARALHHALLRRGAGASVRGSA